MHCRDEVFADLLQYNMGFCIHCSSVVDELAIVEKLFWKFRTCFLGHCHHGKVTIVERLK